jgi:hypothetical protein
MNVSGELDGVRIVLTARPVNVRGRVETARRADRGCSRRRVFGRCVAMGIRVAEIS